MAYGLSFSAEFYQLAGDEELLPADMEGIEPVSVWQALLAMSERDWETMSREVFGHKGIDVETVMDKIRQTDTCSDLSSPVTVWIDDEGYWTVDVFENSDDN